MVNKGHILFIVENNRVPGDLRVTNEARAAREFGYAVSIICPSVGRMLPFVRVIEGIRIYNHPQPREGSAILPMLIEYINAPFWEFVLSLWIYSTRPFHIIHGANPPDHIFLLSLPFKAVGVKYVFDHHDIAPEAFVAKYRKKGLFWKLLVWMERLTFMTADLVISTNESYKRIAIKRGHKKEEEIVVVRNGIDLDQAIAAHPKENLKEGFSYLVGYVGTIAQQEGIENLLHVVHYLINVKNRKDIKFIIVGAGPHLKAVINEAKKMGLERHVVFTGFIPEKAKSEVLASSDVCVNPEFGNEFTENSTMIKVMEYMAVGKPTIQFYTREGEFTAKDSAISIKENDISQFAEALLDLLDDPERRRIMGEAGRKRIEEELAWSIQKKYLEAAYRKLLSP